MNVIDREKALATARVWQPLVCLSLLAGIGLSALALEAARRSEALGSWVDRRFAEATDNANLYRRLYVDNEDRTLLEELENLDASRGGVYFFGGSNMMWATSLPESPPSERRLIHNFGVGGESSARYVRQYLEFLVEDKHVLQPAGSDKSLFVFGTSFLNIKPPCDEPGNVFTNMWRRRGLYRYDLERGIEPVACNELLRRYLVCKGRWASLVQGYMERFERGLVPKSLRRRSDSKIAEVYTASYRRRLGPDWEEDLAAHRRDLQQLADYVRRKKLNFMIVLLPLASWHKPLPYPPRYHAMIEEFCAANDLPLVDYSDLLTDDDFIDHIHVNQRGLPKINAALMDVARKFLKE